MKKHISIICFFIFMFSINLLSYTWDSDTVAVYCWKNSSSRVEDDTGNGYNATNAGGFIAFHDGSTIKYDAYITNAPYSTNGSYMRMNADLQTYLGDKSFSLQYYFKARACGGHTPSPGMYYDVPIAKGDSEWAAGPYGIMNYWFNDNTFACNINRVYANSTYQQDTSSPGDFGSVVFCSMEWDKDNARLKYFINGALKFTFNSCANPFSATSSGNGGYLDFGHAPSENAGNSGIRTDSGLDRVVFVKVLMSGAEKLPVSNTNTFTPTATNTNTVTFTATATNTNTATSTVTFTATFTPTNTLTFTPTNTVTQTTTQTVTPSITVTVTQTITPSVTLTVTQTITTTVTKTITQTITQTETQTITQTITLTITQTLTQTLTQTVTQTITPTVTITPTFIMIPITDECKCQGDMSFIRFIKGYGFAIIRERLQI